MRQSACAHGATCVCRERVRSSDVADSPADAIEAVAQSGEAAKISQQLEVVVVARRLCHPSYRRTCEGSVGIVWNGEAWDSALSSKQ